MLASVRMYQGLGYFFEEMIVVFISVVVGNASLPHIEIRCLFYFKIFYYLIFLKEMQNT